jgi:hypothetical protein
MKNIIKEENMHHDKKCTHEHKGFLACVLSWKGVALILALAGVSYYLLTVHLEHLAVALPYLILLACPLMHIFGHRHGHHHDESGNNKQKGE